MHVDYACLFQPKAETAGMFAHQAEAGEPGHSYAAEQESEPRAWLEGVWASGLSPVRRRVRDAVCNRAGV